MKDYLVKDLTYFTNVRVDVISCVPDNPNNKILEVGCGTGDTLLKLKMLNKAQEIVGIELMNIPDSNQKSIDKLFIGDIESLSLDNYLNYFDVIICADVLEHLVDPWKTLEKLSSYLKPGGIVIGSLPNIRNFVPMFKVLVLRDFRYDPAGGVLDKTHMRFFCKKNIIQLFTTQELLPQKCVPAYKLRPFAWSSNRMRWVNIVTLGLFQDILASQYLIVANKKNF
jgi:2-polyprenyl-3-methyl-5-hydroxy-6-metoxy-1,4-benzoquinol methylase